MFFFCSFWLSFPFCLSCPLYTSLSSMFLNFFLSVQILNTNGLLGSEIDAVWVCIVHMCTHTMGGGCLYYYRVISRVISCNSSHLIRRYFISLEIFPVSFTGGESNTCLTEWGNWLGRGRGSLMVQNINFTLCSCFESFPSHLLAAVMDIPNYVYKWVLRFALQVANPCEIKLHCR